MIIPSNDKIKKIFWRCVGFVDQINSKLAHSKGIPPAILRFKANGSILKTSFVKQGIQTCDDLKNALQSVGKDLQSFGNILDFGCGGGRTIIHLEKTNGKIYGTDNDQSAIEWTKKNITKATFDTNTTYPPLKYPQNTFDLIYAFSVFTHLPHDLENQWLLELKRILCHDGILLISIQGPEVYKKLNHNQQQQINQLGRLELVDGDWRYFFGDWYKNTFHQKEYTLKKFGEHFTVLNYLPRGLCHYQDIIILQKSTDF